MPADHPASFSPSPDPTPAPLEGRLRHLERANRRLSFAVAGLAGLLLVAFTRPPTIPDVLEAKRIRVVDEKGLTRIDLKYDTLAAGMFVHDAQGAVRLGALYFGDGGGLAVYGPSASRKAILYLRDHGSITIYDSTGNAVWRAKGERSTGPVGAVEPAKPRP